MPCRDSRAPDFQLREPSVAGEATIYTTSAIRRFDGNEEVELARYPRVLRCTGSSVSRQRDGSICRNAVLKCRSGRGTTSRREVSRTMSENWSISASDFQRESSAAADVEPRRKLTGDKNSVQEAVDEAMILECCRRT